METSDTPRPRKKSRFFPDAKSVIAPIARRDTKLDSNVAERYSSNTSNSEEPAGHDGISSSVISIPVQEAAIDRLDRSFNADQRPPLNRASTSLPMDVPKHHELLKSTSTTTSSDLGMRGRRQGIYGAQQLGPDLQANSPARSNPSSYNDLPQPPSGLGLPLVAASRDTFPLPQPAMIDAQSRDSPYALNPNFSTGTGSGHSHIQQGSNLPHYNLPLQNHLSGSSYLPQLPKVDPVSMRSLDLKTTSASFDPFAGFQRMRSAVPDTSSLDLTRPCLDTHSWTLQTKGTLGGEKPDRTPDQCSAPGSHQVFSDRISQGSASDTEHTKISVVQDNLTLRQQSMSKQVASAPSFSNLRYPFGLRADGRTNEQDTDMPSASIAGMQSVLSQQESFAGIPMDNTTVDLDRDANGTLLPLHLRHRTILQFSQTQVRYSARRSSTPANLYTSPKRMERVLESSSSALKRKHPGINLPPPSHIYVRSNDPNFNVFSNGVLLYPELCFMLASHMALRDLVSLYSISRDFHTIIDSRFTTVCLSQASGKAPQSARTFTFRAYAEFCRDDPSARIPHPNPRLASLQLPRKIPSFRWVAFVLHREKVVHELMTVFAERGCPLPARCSLALKKMWMLMDIPDNARRIAIIHNHRIFTDLDLYFTMCFVVKLDMIAHDPITVDKRDGLRKLLLSQKGGLSVILKVLKREMWQKNSEFVLAWVRNTMNMVAITDDRLDELGVTSVFGVPREEVGIGKYEYWGVKGVEDDETGQRRAYLLRPDQLVMREAIRRGIPFTKHFFRCILYGYVRPDTLEDYEPRNYGRRVAEWEDEEYDINDGIGGIRALTIQDGGDPLLDLGDAYRGSRWTVETEVVSVQEQMMRDGQEKFRTQMYEISENERRA